MLEKETHLLIVEDETAIREGLERTKLVRAASGFEGTTLGFGRWEREALKGPYLVMRQWVDAESVEVPRA